MIKNLPEKIYLQTFCEGDEGETAFEDLADVTWCAEQINESDIEYILAQPQDCTRSHPHEEMSKECELRTEIAKLRNRLAQRERVLFPTMLRRMWSGGDVQEWLDKHVNSEVQP